MKCIVKFHAYLKSSHNKQAMNVIFFELGSNFVESNLFCCCSAKQNLRILQCCNTTLNFIRFIHSATARRHHTIKTLNSTYCKVQSNTECYTATARRYHTITTLNLTLFKIQTNTQCYNATVRRHLILKFSEFSVFSRLDMLAYHCKLHAKTVTKSSAESAGSTIGSSMPVQASATYSVIL